MTRARHYAVLRRRMKSIGPVRLFGMKLAELAPGRAILTMETGARHRHPDAVHGGVIAALADTALALAIYTRIPPGTKIATVEMNISYLNAHQRGRLRARARVLRLGRRLAFGEVEVRNRGGNLVAKSRMIYSVRRMEEKRS